MFLLVKSSGAQVKMLREIALKMQELSPFVNKKLGFRSIFGHQRPSISLAHPDCQELLGRDQAAYLGFKNLKKEAYLRAQNSHKLRPKKWLNKVFPFLAKFF